MEKIELIIGAVGIIYIMIGVFVATLICNDPSSDPFGLILVLWPLFVVAFILFIVLYLVPTKLAIWIKEHYW